LASRSAGEKANRGFARDPSDRARPPDFRAGLGEWARKSGCAVFRMTARLFLAQQKRNNEPQRLQPVELYCAFGTAKEAAEKAASASFRTK